MNNSNKNKDKANNSTETQLKTNPKTGLLVINGPKFTKEDVARDFPVDCCRDAIILRRSVGLGNKDPFENKGSGESEANKIDLSDKDQVAHEFPRDCCRFARSIRRSVGLTGKGLANGSNKCCFAD